MMCGDNITGPRKDRVATFILALLKPRRARNGWVKPTQLAEEAGVSRATAYRYLTLLESCGFPIQRGSDGKPRGSADTLGVRSLLVLGEQLEPDPDPQRWAA